MAGDAGVSGADEGAARKISDPDKKALIILAAKESHGRSVFNPVRFIPFQEELEGLGYEVETRQAGNTDELQGILTEKTEAGSHAYDFLVIGAHGNHTCMNFGKGFFDLSSSISAKRFAFLKPKAQIILLSCNTGGGLDRDGGNIA